MMKIASALLWSYNSHESWTRSGLVPPVVLMMTALGSARRTFLTTPWEYVFSGSLVDHKIRQFRSLLASSERIGPIPDPVATSTIRLKMGTTWRTPIVGIPRTHNCFGGFSMSREVQSPAFETRI